MHTKLNHSLTWRRPGIFLGYTGTKQGQCYCGFLLNPWCNHCCCTDSPHHHGGFQGCNRKSTEPWEETQRFHSLSTSISPSKGWAPSASLSSYTCHKSFLCAACKCCRTCRNARNTRNSFQKFWIVYRKPTVITRNPLFSTESFKPGSVFPDCAAPWLSSLTCAQSHGLWWLPGQSRCPEW